MSLASERQALAELVTDATSATTYPYLPGRITAASGVIIPGSPYLESPDTFGRGKFKARWDVVLVVQGITNETSTPQLDLAVEDAVVALIEAGYSVESVSEPFSWSPNGSNYLASTITTTKQIQL